MRTLLLSLAPLLALAAAAEPAGAPVLSGAEEKSVRESLLKDRRDAREWLRSDPGSYLAAVKRVDFGSRQALTAGSAHDDDVRLEAGEARPHHLRISVQGDRFRVEAVDPAATFIVGKSTAAAAVREAAVDPSSIRVGRYLLRLSHQGYPAVIVFDPKSPRFKKYRGIEYFPVDLSYRYVVKLVPDPAAETVAVGSTHSADRRAVRVGWFDFRVGKTPCRLAAYRLLEPGVEADSVSVLFRDATTGRETYAVGRYVDPKKRADGSYVLDFNTAYSPACAFSAHYNCPIPPKENHLTVAVEAGERDSHYH